MDDEMRVPTPGQAVLIRQAGLVPDEWRVRLESRQYLYLGNTRHETVIIDKATGRPAERKGIKE